VEIRTSTAGHQQGLKVERETEDSCERRMFSKRRSGGHSDQIQSFWIYWEKWVTHETPHRPDVIFMNQ